MGSFLETSIDPNGFRKTGRETPEVRLVFFCNVRFPFKYETFQMESQTGQL